MTQLAKHSLHKPDYLNLVPEAHVCCQMVVVHTFNPRTLEAEARRSLSSRPAGLQYEFQDSQGYLSLKKIKIRREGGREEERKQAKCKDAHL